MENGSQLAKICQDTRQALLDGIDWLDTYQAELRQDTSKLTKKLKINAFKAKKLMQAAQRKPGIGVFGASQAGKSYLVSTLARRGANRLMAVFGDEAVDFIEAINPEGGKESTGVVTRFTVDEPKPPRPDYPVCLNLLSLTDIIKILANAYVFDLRHENDKAEDHDPAAIDARLKELEAKVAGAPLSALSEEDILDLEHYCLHKLGNKNSNRRIAALTAADYWSRAAIVAPRLANPDLIRLFALLWEELEAFSKVFDQLLDALTQLNHTQIAYGTLESLCATSGDRFSRLPNGSSIVDVETLLQRGLGGGETDTDHVSLCTTEGTLIRLSRNVLTALIAELVITMQEKPADFFDHTDLLDFPGARSRETRVKDPKYLDDTESRPRLFLRGKVAYLFERYCENKELTTLLLCSGFENMEVISLPEMVFDWIAATHGKTPEQRANQSTSLFLVMTKFDVTAFKQAAGDGDMANRWTTRLETSLIKPYSQIPNDWPNHWQGEGRVFNNCFCVRNPNYRQDHIFDYDADAASMQETGIRLDKQGFIDTLKQSFVDNELLKTHLFDPAKAWDALMGLNDGGISLLRSRIGQACSPDLKEQQISARIQDVRAEAAKQLGAFFVSGDLNQELDRKRGLAKQLRLALSRSKDRFPAFIQMLQVEEDSLYNLYIRVGNMSHATETKWDHGSTGTAGGEAGPDGDPLESDPLDDLFGEEDPLEAGETPSQDPLSPERPALSPSNDFAARFVATIKDYWETRLIELSNDQSTLGYFHIEKQHILDIAHELSLGMQRLQLLEEITQQVRETGDYREVDVEAQRWKTVAPAHYRFNEFINWLGYGGCFAPEGTAISLRDILGKDGERMIFARPAFPGEYPELSDTEPDFGRQYFTDWLTGFSKLILENVPFYLDIKINVDPAMNGRLGDILTVLN